MKKIPDPESGSMTVEAALLMPLILGVIFLVVYLSVYMYNRAAVTCAAARTAVLAGQMEHEGGNIIEAECMRVLGQSVDALPMTYAATKAVEAGLLSVETKAGFSQSRGFFFLPVKKGDYVFEKSFRTQRLDPARFLWSVKIVENKKQSKRSDPDMKKDGLKEKVYDTR